MEEAISGQACKERALGTGFSVEVILERSLGVKPRIAPRIKESKDVAGGVGPNGVERFIDRAKAQISLHGLARCILCGDVEAAFFARKVFVFAWRGSNGETTLGERYGNALLRSNKLVCVDEHGTDN